MAKKEDLESWVVEALRAQGGSAHHIQVAKHIWANHEQELRDSGDLFYTWQYELRWAADRLRIQGRLQLKPKGDRGPWQLAE